MSIKNTKQGLASIVVLGSHPAIIFFAVIYMCAERATFRKLVRHQCTELTPRRTCYETKHCWPYQISKCCAEPTCAAFVWKLVEMHPRQSSSPSEHDAPPLVLL